MVISVFVVVVSFISITLFKWFDSFYSDEIRKDKAFRKKIILLNKTIDSLSTEVVRRDSFLLSFKKMLTGDKEALETARLKVRNEQEPTITKHESHISEAELALRAEFEGKKPKATFVSSNEASTGTKTSLSNIYFFPPISGLVSNHFDKDTKHYGVDILAKENEPIKCIASGSVIYSGWSFDTGYMLVVQHDEDLISVYKHNASLLKKVGDNVNSGEVVAIIGNSGEITTGPHLHFELWYKGHPLNPLDYIVF